MNDFLNYFLNNLLCNNNILNNWSYRYNFLSICWNLFNLLLNNYSIMWYLHNSSINHNISCILFYLDYLWTLDFNLNNLLNNLRDLNNLLNCFVNWNKFFDYSVYWNWNLDRYNDWFLDFNNFLDLNHFIDNFIDL